MENSQQIQDSQTPEMPADQTGQPAPPLQSSSDQKQAKSKKKSRLILAIVILLVLLAGSASAYTGLVYLPNKPENVFKKAASNYASTNSGYTVSGRLDQSGPNDPDFDYVIRTNANKDSYIEVQAGTFLQHPKLTMQKVGGKYYVNFSQFEDSKKLASHYANYGFRGIQEHIAEFTDKSNLFTNQDKWLEVDSYILEQPAVKNDSTNYSASFDGMTLGAVGPEETINGKATRKYQVALTSDAFKQVVAQIDSSANLPILSSLFPNTGLSAEQVKADVWVNLETKTFEQIKYEGRPFRDATFSLKLNAVNDHVIVAPEAEKLTSKLGYGVITTRLFNQKFQQGDSEADKERIADMKGIKTALEIYKAKTGHYPERYEMSVDQESFIGGQMPGAEFEIFKDPVGRFIGLNGSQYAYVSALNDDTQDCGKFSSKPCEKYFIVTTLDSGQQYQLNSN